MDGLWLALVQLQTMGDKCWELRVVAIHITRTLNFQRWPPTIATNRRDMQSRSPLIPPGANASFKVHLDIRRSSLDPSDVSEYAYPMRVNRGGESG